MPSVSFVDPACLDRPAGPTIGTAVGTAARHAVLALLLGAAVHAAAGQASSGVRDAAQATSGAGHGGGPIYLFTIDTTPLAGLDGWLAFDLVDGRAGSTSVVEVSAFASTGSLGGSTSSGDVNGSLLAPPLRLQAGQFFSSHLQAIRFAEGVTEFRVDLTPRFVDGEIPDGLAFFLLDAGFNPWSTSDPTGANALFAIDLDSMSLPQLFDSAFAQVSVAVIPEPGPAVLLVAGLAVLSWRLRNSPRARG